MGLIIILTVALLVVGILGAVVYIIISKGKEKHLLEDDKGLGSDLSSSQNMLSSTSDVNPLFGQDTADSSSMMGSFQDDSTFRESAVSVPTMNDITPNNAEPAPVFPEPPVPPAPAESAAPSFESQQNEMTSGTVENNFQSEQTAETFSQENSADSFTQPSPQVDPVNDNLPAEPDVPTQSFSEPDLNSFTQNQSETASIVEPQTESTPTSESQPEMVPEIPIQPESLSSNPVEPSPVLESNLDDITSVPDFSATPEVEADNNPVQVSVRNEDPSPVVEAENSSENMSVEEPAQTPVISEETPQNTQENLVPMVEEQSVQNSEPNFQTPKENISPAEAIPNFSQAPSEVTEEKEDEDPASQAAMSAENPKLADIAKGLNIPGKPDDNEPPVMF